MKIAIFQINNERDKHHVRFMNFERTRHVLGSNEIQSEIYEKVFEGEMNCLTLEDVYTMFNTNHPDGYFGRSMSVSDIVQIFDGVESGFYFCDSFGWKKVQLDPTKIVDAAR